MTASFVCRVVDSDSVYAKLKHAVVGVLIAGTVHCIGNTCIRIPEYLLNAGVSIWVVVASLFIPFGSMAAKFIFAWNQTLWYARHAKYDNAKNKTVYLKLSPFKIGGSYFG